MKRLLLIISLFYSLYVNAQTYIPFPVTDAIWTVDIIMPGQWPGQEYHAPAGYTIFGDSLINGLLYSKIYLSDSAGNIDPSGLTALTREQNKMVYCKYLGSHNQQPNELILYDFNLTTGDTFSFPSYGFQSELIVDSVGPFQTSAGSRNAVYLSFISNPGNAFYANPVWVEGIGDIANGVIYHEVPWVDWWCEGLCFSYQNILIWSRYGSYCWLNTGVNEVSGHDNMVTCHPNPSKDEMVITFHDPFKGKTLEVYDLTGRIVFETTIHNNEFILEKQKMGCGMFTARITNGSGDVFFKKIVFAD